MLKNSSFVASMEVAGGGVRPRGTPAGGFVGGAGGGVRPCGSPAGGFVGGLVEESDLVGHLQVGLWVGLLGLQ